MQRSSNERTSSPADELISVGGMRIHYLDWGTQGEQPLVLLHGIARLAHNFDHLAPHFSARHHVIAVDLRGHGDSAWDADGAYFVEDYVRDVEALIDALGLRDIVLWGNSTGGRVAQYIAGTRPELVAAAVIEDVGPERPAAIPNRRAARMQEEENGWPSCDDLFAKVKSDQPLTPDAVLRNFVLHGSKQREDGRIVWRRDPAILKGFVPTELWDAVKGIRAPILYVLGGASTIVPPDTQAKIRKLLPQAEFVTMPRLGHYPSDEKPEDFLGIVDRFLRERVA